MVARDAERGAAARDRVAERVAASGANGRGRLELEVCDLSDLDAVRDFAADFAARTPRLGGLLHNAGVLPPRRERSAQGHELTFATNVLGPFLLTNLLLDSLRRSAPSRVVLMSSGGMYTSRLDLDDLELEDRDFDGASLLRPYEADPGDPRPSWAERERERRRLLVRAPWMGRHARRTGVASPFLPRAAPAATGSRPGRRHRGVASGDLGRERRPGAFWHDRRQRPEHRVPWTRESPTERRELWTKLAHLTGWDEGNDDDEGD